METNLANVVTLVIAWCKTYVARWGIDSLMGFLIAQLLSLAKKADNTSN